MEQWNFLKLSFLVDWNLQFTMMILGDQSISYYLQLLISSVVYLLGQLCMQFEPCL